MKKLSGRELKIAIGLGLALGIFLVDQYAWTPYEEARAHLQADLAKAREKQASADRLIRDDRRNRATYDQMIADGLKADGSEAESQMLHAVDDWARSAGLSLPTVKRERMEQDKVFGRIVFRASGAGTMSSIARFLWNVQTSKVPARVVDLQIAGRQGAKEGTDDLTVSVAISTLVRGQVPTTGPAAVSPAAGAVAMAGGEREGR